MWLHLRILALIAAFALVFVHDKPRNDVGLADLAPFALIVYVCFLGVALLIGLVALVVCKGPLRHPSLSLRPFMRNAPLQIPYFAGFLFVAAGAAQLAQGFRSFANPDGLVVLAMGLGLISGCRLIGFLFHRRFMPVAGHEPSRGLTDPDSASPR